MSLHMTLADHDADPPSAWQVVKAGSRSWYLNSSLGATISSYPTRQAAEAGRESGPFVTLWEQEGRWMRGEAIPGWRPYAKVLAQQEAAAARRERAARVLGGPGDGAP